MATISKATYASRPSEVPGFPSHAFAVTPSDTDIYDPAIMVDVGGAGNVAVIPDLGDRTTVVVFSGRAAGSVVPVKVRQVMATNTTATLLTGLI